MKFHIIVFLFLGLADVVLFAQISQISEVEKGLALKTDTARVNALNTLSVAYAKFDLDHADSLAGEAFALLQTLNYPEGRIANLNQLSFIKCSLGQYDAGLPYSDESLRLSEHLGNKRLLAESYHYRFILLFRKGAYLDAAEPAEKSMEFAREVNADDLIARAYDDLGMLRGVRGFHSDAIEFFMNALLHYEKAGDVAGTVVAYMHLGHTFELAQNYDKALEYLEKSIESSKRTSDKYMLGWGLVNLGVVYSRLNRFDTAVTFYHQALRLAEEMKDHRLTLTCLDNIGGKYSLKGDFEKANHYLQKAYKLSQESGTNSRTVYIIGNLAENYLLMGRFDSARVFAQQQLALALASGLITEQKVAYYNLAQIYDSLGDHESAYNSLVHYIAVNDSIFNREKSEQIENLRETFESEKKEQMISNLTAVNESQKFKNRTYAAAAIVFLVLGSMLFYVQQLRAKRNRLLLEKEQEVDRMKTRFFTNISHEFRTPLTLIVGPVADLISKTEDPHTKKQLRVMEKNANRLLDLINQLLDLAKIESGKMKLQPSNGDIITVLKGVALSFHSIMEQKDINLNLDVAPETLHINFDRPKFETILTNLLANAFKFTPANGNITVASSLIKKNRSKHPRECLEISVSDSGIGIPERDLDNIFNRFYQSDNNQLRQHEGSGIGLALSKELVELHGGNIKIASEISQGTTVVFDIPADIPGSESEPVGQFSAKPSIVYDNAVDIAETENPPGLHLPDSRPVVLVVEDHPEVQQYIHSILDEKFSVLAAENGEVGITEALERIPDLIISDVMMPIKDGYEVCRTLKSDERTSHIPIVLLTAKADLEHKIDGLKTRADDYLTKPFIPEELLLRIENLIESRKRLRARYKKESTLKPAEITENSVDEKFLQKMIGILEAEIGNERFGVEQLSREIGMSRSQLHRKLKALLDQGPNQFIRSFRLNRAHDLLKQRVATAAEIGYRVGFSSPSYFTKCFQEQFGHTPSEIFEKTRV